MFQVPATHPKGVTASGHLNMVAEDGVPNVPFFQTDENIAVKVSLPGFFIQFFGLFLQARFSNVGGCGADDRSTCVRGCLIALASSQENFHLHMNTGTAGVFENFLLTIHIPLLI